MDTEPPPRRRPVFAITGWLMFVLLFAPTLQVCNSPTSPVEFPPFYFFYVGSAIAAVTALCATRSERKYGTIALVALWMIAVGMIAVGFAYAAGGAVFAVVVAVLALALLVVLCKALARSRLGERTVLATMILHSVFVLALYAMLASDRDALWGAHAGFAVAGVMTLSAIANLVLHEVERTRDHRMRPALPRARVVR